jgi:hypothetical protein
LSFGAAQYLIGIHPGGDPIAHATETIGSHTEQVLNQFPDRWSAYGDESWQDKIPGTHGMQPRVLHMLRRLGRDPYETPASNLIFLRSTREATLSGDKNELVDLCWPFHEAVIVSLQPKVIVCFGKLAGMQVRRRLKAEHFIQRFTENNDRRWQSDAHRAEDGQIVITASHPSVADWTNPVTDPTPLIEEMLRVKSA